MSTKTTSGNHGNGFKPGQSGNPSGRPKRTQEERDALEAIRKLAQDTPAQLEKLIKGTKTPPAVRLKAIEIVLDRTYGKPDATVRLETPKADMLEDIREEMERLKAVDVQ